MKFISEERKIRIDPLENGSGVTEASAMDGITDPVKLTKGIMSAGPQTRVRKYMWLRLSEIDGMCPREWVIGHVNDRPRTEKVPFAMTCVMDMGSALHFWIQNYGHKIYFPDGFFGFWRCSACGNRRRFGTKPKDICEFCQASPRATFYDEYMFRLQRDKDFHVVGKIDGIIKVGSKYRFIDIKTYGKPIDGPQGRDVMQLASYMYFSQFDDTATAVPIEIDRSTGYLVYFSKLFNYRAPIKTFPVRPNEGMMEPVIQKARDFTAGVRTGTLPGVLPQCFAARWRSGRANKCSMKDWCQDYHSRDVANIKGG